MCAAAAIINVQQSERPTEEKEKLKYVEMF